MKKKELLTWISTSARNNAENVRKNAEVKGYVVSEEEFEIILQYTARKCRIKGKDEDYFLLLLEDEIKDYYFRGAVNAISLAMMATI